MLRQRKRPLPLGEGRGEGRQRVMHDAESSIDWPQVAVHGNPPTGRWVSCCGPVRCWRYGEYACPAPCIRAPAKCIWGSICSPWPTRRRGAAFDYSVLCGGGLGRDAAHPPQAAPHRGQARSHSMDGGAALPAHAWPRARTARGEIADRPSGLARGAPEFGAVVARRHGRRGPQQIGAAGVCRQGVGYF